MFPHVVSRAQPCRNVAGPPLRSSEEALYNFSSQIAARDHAMNGDGMNVMHF